MDPFGQSSMSPSDFFGGYDTATPQQQQVLQPGPRNYKSRKYRPCDFCRARQVACKIEIGPPCSLCRSHSRDCTFVERPKKKRRPNNNATNGENHDLGQSIDPALTLDPSNGHGQLNNFVPHFDEQLFERPLPLYHENYHGLQHSHDPTHQQGLSSPGFNQLSPLDAIHERSLDSPSSRPARFIGETGESNPYLLRHYRYDENDECTVSKLTYRRIRRASQIPDHVSDDRGELPVVFMLADETFSQKGEPRVDEGAIAQARSEVAAMFTEQEAISLAGLYFRFVDPYFPILARSQILSVGSISLDALNTLPLSLLSAMYATALPFMLYDDLLATTIVHSPSPAHQLYRISWLAVTQEQHAPRLATLQACLLLLQRAPTNRYTTDTPWKTSLVGWTVSLAQTLGLTRECGDWTRLPQWELCLRKRLWHGVFIMDKWASLGAGMPSHIRKEDYDVLPLMPQDCETQELDQHDYSTSIGLPGPSEGDSHFRLLADLTLILSDIMDAFYTLAAIQHTSNNLTLSLDLGRPLRSRLKSWNDSLPPALSLRYPERVDSRGMAKLSGNPSLSLAYIVATMTLFRALLRPLDNLINMDEEDHGVLGSRMAVRAGAKECAKEVVEFAENLGRGALDAFWHSWSRANFAIASSFLMQLLITSETPNESAEIHDLVARWRWALRIGSGSTGSGLMSLGLLRLDGLLLENGSTGSALSDRVGRSSSS